MSIHSRNRLLVASFINHEWPKSYSWHRFHRFRGMRPPLFAGSGTFHELQAQHWEYALVQWTVDRWSQSTGCSWRGLTETQSCRRCQLWTPHSQTAQRARVAYELSPRKLPIGKSRIIHPAMEVSIRNVHFSLGSFFFLDQEAIACLDREEPE